MTPTQTKTDLASVGLDLLDIGNEVQLVGVIYGGKGKTVIMPFPEDKLTGLVDDWIVVEMDAEQWAEVLNQSDNLNTMVGKAMLRKSQRHIDQVIAWKVFERDRYHCRYCGRTGLPLTVDHVILWEDGGPTIEDNLISACRKCNKTRGRMQYEDWLGSDAYNAVSAAYLSESDKERNWLVITRLEFLRAKRVNVRSR
jgi:hypothetical protein